MAIQSEIFSTAFGSRTFVSTKHIGSKQNVAVWLKRVEDDVWIELSRTRYELINNSVVLQEAPAQAIYSQVEVRVADEPDELGASQSDIAIVASLSNEIQDIATQVVPNLPEILLADDNAIIATQKALEASNSATSASSSATTATTKAGEASTSANNASTSAANALAYRDTASTHATTATTKAGIATTKAGEASTSATASANSASQALGYKNEAQAARNEAVAIVTAPLLGAIGNINSPLLDLPLKNSLSMKAGVGSVTFTRATTATYIDRYGVLKYAGIDEPRFEKDGLLIEGASTNFVLNSSDLSTLVGSVTPIQNYGMSPDGTKTSTRLVFTGENQAMNSLATLGTGVLCSSSVWIKGTAGETINLTAGGTDNLVTIQTNEWERIKSENLVSNGGHFSINTYLGATARDFEVWGAQLEALPFATSYIPTTTSAVTRSADICSVDISGNVAPVNESHTILVDSSTLGHTGIDNQVIWYIANSYYENISSWWGGAKNTPLEYYNVNIGGPLGLIQTENYRFGAILDADLLTRSHSTDGVIDKTTNVSLLSYSIPSNFYLGSAGSIGFLYGHIKNFRIYDKALTAQEVALA